MADDAEQLRKLDELIEQSPPSARWVCGGCWSGVEQGQTECYKCGAELTTHPMDEGREPWRESGDDRG